MCNDTQCIEPTRQGYVSMGRSKVEPYKYESARQVQHRYPHCKVSSTRSFYSVTQYWSVWKVMCQWYNASPFAVVKIRSANTFSWTRLEPLCTSRWDRKTTIKCWHAVLQDDLPARWIPPETFRLHSERSTSAFAASDRRRQKTGWKRSARQNSGCYCRHPGNTTHPHRELP